MKKHIPNLITLFNVFCGCCAIVNVSENQMLVAIVWLGIGMLADFMDGAVARLLNVKSALGQQLDSLADMVSFGVAPGLIFYKMLAFKQSGFVWEAIPAFILTMAACYRLGKFNIDLRQTNSFIGMPTPACTIFVIGIALVAHFNSFEMRHFIYQPLFLYACILMLSYLMLSELPMFSLKIERLTWQTNEIKVIFAAAALLLLILLQEAAFSLIIIIYLLISIAMSLFKRGRVIGKST